MSTGREQILGALRRSLKRGTQDDAAIREVDQRLARHPRNLVPARAQLPADQRLDLFERQAREQAASVDRVAQLSDLPQAIAAYLKDQNLPAEVRSAPDALLDSLPWDSAPLVTRSSGPARESDPVSLTRALAGIAETGTLMLRSGADGPTTLNFLPETNIVVLEASHVVASYEDSWDLLRSAVGDGALPRTVNLITGPSRTGDIEQKIQLGAHGPRQLHILLVGAPTDG